MSHPIIDNDTPHTPEADPAAPARRLNRLIDLTDRPLLGLAIVSLVLYLFDLRGLPPWADQVVGVVNMITDALFLIDLVIKLIAQGKTYTDSPWFLIDFLSSLPAIDTLANGLIPLHTIRVVRGFRILRILRGLRVLRALRSIPAFDQFDQESRPSEGQRGLHRGMNLVLLGLTGVVLVSIVSFRRSMEEEYVKRIDEAVIKDISLPHLKAIGGSLVPPDVPDSFVRRAVVNGREHTVYFDLRAIDRRVNQFEFFLTVGMLFSMLFIIYILAYHHMDVSRSQLRSLLSLALPRQVADRLLADPNVYTARSRMAATVLFMDFVGFTRTCEELADDPDRLSGHLEAAMDRLVSELAINDMIIDKFIGDAVMSFRGGPLVDGGPADHAVRAVRAALGSIRALAALNDPYFHKVKIGGASDPDCLIGAFGTRARLSYTILGDGVNLAARLEPACAQCGTQDLFDETTFKLCAGQAEFAWRRWGRIRVLGKAEPVAVYEAFDAVRLPDAAFIATFHDALDAFESNDFERAHALFVLAENQREGGDPPSRDYAHRCEQLLQSGRPVGWEPVLDTHK